MRCKHVVARLTWSASYTGATNSTSAEVASTHASWLLTEYVDASYMQSHGLMRMVGTSSWWCLSGEAMLKGICGGSYR
jgi:hypothetical protein